MTEYDPQLLIFLFLSLFIAALVLIVGFGSLLTNASREVRIVFFLLTVAVSAFVVLRVLGVFAPDVGTARLYFLLSLVVFFAGSFLIHAIIAAFFRVSRALKSVILSAAYLLSLALCSVLVVTPDSIMADPEPKLYFPYYPVAGNLYWVSGIFVAVLFVSAVGLLSVALVRALREEDSVLANRTLYALLAVVVGLGFGATTMLLPYDVPFDPVWSLFFGVSLFPLAYATLSHSVLDMGTALKRAGIFMVAVAVTWTVLVGVTVVTDQLKDLYPDFPGWVIPLVVAVTGAFSALYFWSRAQQSDLLKYEFITVVTHKFRTPLTRIKWSVQMLKTAESEEEKAASAEEIAYSAQKLVELTNTLVGASKVEGVTYQYKFTVQNLNSFVITAYESVRHRMEKKEISYSFDYDDSFSKVYADSQRLGFVLQIFFENAVSYTPHGGSVSVHIKKRDDKVLFSITDSGIGISSEELPRIFTKFYRTKRAKLADTEGIGIGLSIARQIVERHGGRTWVTSPGPNRGTTVWMELPNASQ